MPPHIPIVAPQLRHIVGQIGHVGAPGVQMAPCYHGLW